MLAYSSRMDEALVFAADAFRGTFRKGSTVPYLTHLISVAALVGEGGGDEDQVIAALLHDYLEDIEGATAAVLEKRFGSRVAGLVLGLSDSVGRPRPPWRERKEAYLALLGSEPAELKLISVADKLHNATSIVRELRRDGVQTFDRFNGKQDGTLWYYRELVVRLADGWSHWLLDELKAMVQVMHALAKAG
jgi:(p)ppGpp synthase/HD superfamily hydrolase